MTASPLAARPDQTPAARRPATYRSPIARDRPEVQLSGPGADKIAEIAGGVPDPELPMVSLANLGVLRSVDVAEGGHVTVTITPTYSGCPALQMMSTDVEVALAEAGYSDVTVNRVLTRAWSSDDMTQAAHTALRDAGIAPPAHRATDAAASVPASTQTGARQGRGGAGPEVTCPLCGARDTEQLSRFGATSCKALYRCRACREPFEYFKVH